MEEKNFHAKKESSPFLAEAKVPSKQPVSSDIKKDFKHVSQLSRHVGKLNSFDKKKFAEKYGISYKDESEIRGEAKKMYVS